jgi:hypothetical protein
MRRRFALALSSAFAAEPDYRFGGTKVMVVPGRVGRPAQGVQGILHAGFRAARAGQNQFNCYDVTYVLLPLWAR